MKRIYENLFIVKPDATEEDVDQLIELISKQIATAGGVVDKVDKWGKRKLAYRVEKNREGYYVLLTFTVDASAVRELERRIRVQDSIIKFLTVRIDEDLKRLAKRQKEREKRAHRRPQPPTPQPSLAAAMLGGEGGHAVPGAPVPAAPAHPAPGIAPAAEPVAEPTPESPATSAATPAAE